MMVGAKPYGQLKYHNVNGKRMAYVDEGQGDAIVFQHGSLPAVGSDCVDWVTKAWVLGRLVAGHTRSVPVF